MATVGPTDLEQWLQYGGTVEEQKTRTGRKSAKVYVAPTGEKLMTSEQVKTFMADNPDLAAGAKAGAKRSSGPSTPEEGAANKENVNKRQKVATGAGAAKSKKGGEGDDRDEAEAKGKKASGKGKDSSGQKGEEEEAADAVAAPKTAAPKKRRATGPRSDDFVAIKEEPKAENELEARAATAGGGEGEARRRLVDFSVVDEEGEEQPLDATRFDKQLFVQGAIYPAGPTTNKDQGRRVASKFGPVKSWRIDYSASSDSAQVVVATEAGEYLADRPGQRYRKVHEHLAQQAQIAFEFLRCIDPAKEGSLELTLDNVIAKLSRTSVSKGYPTTRDALVVNGNFVLKQLASIDGSNNGKRKCSLEDVPAVKTLKQEVEASRFARRNGTGTIVINEPAAALAAAGDGDDAMEVDERQQADEEFARQLQAKMDAQQMQGAGRGRTPKGGASAYIRISESEIADDYPLPKQYSKDADETDELEVFWDEDLMGCDPEFLPRKLLSDFSIYNSEGFMSTLELLPLWRGADPDVELYASGLVTEDDGEWAGAHTTTSAANNAEAGGSGSGSGSGAGAEEGGSAGTAAAAASGGSGEATGAAQGEVGMRLYLSQIREWVVEYSCDALFITVRTDMAWYKLCKPADSYSPWFSTVLKASRLAVRVIGELEGESRINKVSFNDIVKRLADTAEEDATYVSKKVAAVERFVVVHGQILLNQFSNYPKEAIKRSAFASTLKLRMEQRRHSKLYAKAVSKAVSRSRGGGGMRVNNNPMRMRDAIRKKPMHATATSMVRNVWQTYFTVASSALEKQLQAEAAANQQSAAAAAGATGGEVLDDLNELEADEEEQQAGAEGSSTDAKAAAATSAAAELASPKPTLRTMRARHAKGEPVWVGSKPESIAGSDNFYKAAKVGEVKVTLGSGVVLVDEEDSSNADDDDEQAVDLGMVQAMWQDSKGRKMVQVRLVLRGEQTVLGDAALEAELFLTPNFMTRPLKHVGGSFSLTSAVITDWSAANRTKYIQQVEELTNKYEESKKAGGSQPLQHFWRTMWVRPEAMFISPPSDLQLGERLPEDDGVQKGVRPTAGGFSRDGAEFPVGCHMYIANHVFEPLQGAVKEKEVAEYAAKGRFHKGGSNQGLRPWGVCELLEVLEPKAGVAAGKKAAPARGNNNKKKSNKKKAESDDEDESDSDEAAAPTQVRVRRFYRPEEVSETLAYEAGSYWDLYYSSTTTTVAISDVISRCTVTAPGAETGPGKHVFVCTHTLDPKARKLSAAPAQFKAPSEGGSSSPTAAPSAKGNAKGKGKAAAEEAAVDDPKGKGKAAAEVDQAGKGKGKAVVEEAGGAGEQGGGKDGVSLATMDIFAGCGGLSEGFHQAGVAHTKWAIEYEYPASEAFKLNHPDAAVFCDNCNVLLAAAMAKAGMQGECMASDEALRQAEGLSEEMRSALPLPGDVQFITGGPPCQGYSGMNRFNKGLWSMVQNSMVMSFLSYCDFYRPKYFLLENVRNFVSHNKGFTFRLVLRTLVAMGYQVRFGVLNAGNFGVAQSRKRTIIWAAAPGHPLPAWPEPLHVFHSPQLAINLPDGTQYCAIDCNSAPLRSVTVRDAIGDLPPIENGADVEEMDYSGPAVSAFQRFIRGNQVKLHEHICKSMNELNQERCRCIPKGVPGADWRVLEEIVRKDPTREKYKGQPLVPWCLPNTADRNNGWRGLFGRLDPSGHFPTSTTDPQPMGKVGQVFHPDQDRIVSVRECARAQGFPDRFRFWGNVHNRHRQIGNAVPPPLAYNLGLQLRKGLEDKYAREAEEALKQQMAALA